jgi:hypothetical protein
MEDSVGGGSLVGFSWSQQHSLSVVDTSQTIEGVFGDSGPKDQADPDADYNLPGYRMNTDPSSPHYGTVERL